MRLREIRQIEITSECNLKCRYCPHPKMKREKAHMDMDVYKQSLEWVKYFVNEGTQTELALTGLGEPLLHPDFVEMVALAREAMPDKKLLFSTNGLLMCGEKGLELCKQLLPYKPHVFVSTHRPEKAQPALMNAHRAGLEISMNTHFVDSAIDWAGQVDWEVSAPRTPCGYLKERLGAIMQDGSLTVCCMDAEGIGVFGNVYDEPGSLETGPYKLCETCNYTIPEEYNKLQHRI